MKLVVDFFERRDHTDVAASLSFFRKSDIIRKYPFLCVCVSMHVYVCINMYVYVPMSMN